MDALTSARVAVRVALLAVGAGICIDAFWTVSQPRTRRLQVAEGVGELELRNYTIVRGILQFTPSTVQHSLAYHLCEVQEGTYLIEDRRGPSCTRICHNHAACCLDIFTALVKRLNSALLPRGQTTHHHDAKMLRAV